MHKNFMYIFERVMKNTNLYKGSITTIILKLLNEHDKMYGYEITKRVKQITKNELQLTEGALYPALHKLETQGLLYAETVKVGNRTRKYYKLTEAGTKETVAKLAALESYIKNMRALVNPKFRDDKN